MRLEISDLAQQVAATRFDDVRQVFIAADAVPAPEEPVQTLLEETIPNYLCVDLDLHKVHFRADNRQDVLAAVFIFHNSIRMLELIGDEPLLARDH